MPRMKLAVITRVPPTPLEVISDNALEIGAGNLALDMNIAVQTQQPAHGNDWNGRYEPLARYLQNVMGTYGAAALSMNLRSPVFALGEILVLDGEAGGRELAGAQRKPSKWDVACETFEATTDGIAAAVRRAQEVLAQQSAAAAQNAGTDEFQP